MTTIDYQRAPECFPALAELAADGEEVIINKDDRPFLNLAAVKPKKKRRQFACATGLIQMADDFTAPLEDFADYM